MIEIEIEDEAWTAALPDAASVVERAAIWYCGSASRCMRSFNALWRNARQ